MLNISKEEKRYTEIELDLHKKLAYEKGRASIIEELEKIKAEMEVIHDRYKINFQGFSMSVAQECIDIIDNEISELKGEQE